ncbi:MAG TPA: lipoprotein insertase outer membrane protein LolB [Burkholderiales bacterium]|nr:lipoprotein insertase outer membrane protein LolB [Burkholderiales bacterium]
MNRVRAWCVLAVAAAVSACATLAPESGVPPVSPAPFDLSGRVLVSYGGRAFSSGVRWQHAPARDEIWLLSPVGQTLAYIVGEADGATLTAADQKQYRAASVESLTRQALDWELPLARLQYWVQGRPVPSSVPDAIGRAADGRLTALTQDGWRIAFVNYPPAEHGGLPRRLDLSSGAYEIRLVIDGWRRESTAP